MNIFRAADETACRGSKQGLSDFTYLFVTDETVILLPESETAVRPADGEGVDDRVPLHLGDSVLVASDLEVGDNGSLVTHENDAGRVGGHGQHHVDLAVGPCRQQALLVVFHLHEVVKEHRHLYLGVLRLLFFFLFRFAFGSSYL